MADSLPKKIVLRALLLDLEAWENHLQKYLFHQLTLWPKMLNFFGSVIFLFLIFFFSFPKGFLQIQIFLERAGQKLSDYYQKKARLHEHGTIRGRGRAQRAGARKKEREVPGEEGRIPHPLLTPRVRVQPLASES